MCILVEDLLDIFASTEASEWTAHTKNNWNTVLVLYIYIMYFIILLLLVNKSNCMHNPFGNWVGGITDHCGLVELLYFTAYGILLHKLPIVAILFTQSNNNEGTMKNSVLHKIFCKSLFRTQGSKRTKAGGAEKRGCDMCWHKNLLVSCTFVCSFFLPGIFNNL